MALLNKSQETGNSNLWYGFLTTTESSHNKEHKFGRHMSNHTQPEDLITLPVNFKKAEELALDGTDLMVLLGKEIIEFTWASELRQTSYDHQPAFSRQKARKC